MSMKFLATGRIAICPAVRNSGIDRLVIFVVWDNVAGGAILLDRRWRGKWVKTQLWARAISLWLASLEFAANFRASCRLDLLPFDY